MTKTVRERMMVDLGGLAPVLRAHAQARHLTVPQAARLVLATALGPTSGDAAVRQEREPDATGRGIVKFSIRLPRGVAEGLSTRARNCGLSHGAYLTTLIDATPAPPLALVNALTASTDQLAVIAADVNNVLRLLRKDSSYPNEDLAPLVHSLVEGTRKHLELASRVVAELRPARTLPARRSRGLSTTDRIAS
jgi:hypothetical protein